MKTKTHIAILLPIAAMLALASPARGAEDPVADGSLKLKLSKRFADRLESKGVKMTPTTFSIREGSIDPRSGTGTLALKGRVRFRTKTRKLVFRKVNARLGDHGVLKVGGVRMFRLAGGGATRNGFGAEVEGINATLTSKGARKLRRRLRLGTLRRMRAGAVAVSVQPRTVEVTGGLVHLVPDPDLSYGSGTLASKLVNHCIQFSSGNKAIAPATKNEVDVSHPYYDFPVSGGTIGPSADAGSIELSGGLTIQNNNSSSPSSAHCGDMPPASRPPLAKLTQTELAYDFGARTVSSHVVITQEGLLPVNAAGDQGVNAGAYLILGAATVSAAPSAHTVTIKNIVVRQNKAAALTLNQAFLQPEGHLDGAQDFDAGDLLGFVDITVTTR